MTSKFRYSPRFTPGGFEFDPIVPVIFTNPNNGWNVEVFCLVDSGASVIILDEKFAKKLHVDLRAGKERTLEVIQEIPVVGYSHKILMRLKDDPHEFEVDCVFVPGLKTDGLLGQKGFFDNYLVVFEGYNQRLEVTPIEAF
jgi:hypothetical protein